MQQLKSSWYDVLPQNAFVSLAAELPRLGTHEVAIHPDLTAVMTTRTDGDHGNLDPRFGNLHDVTKARLALLAKVGCESMVSMVPYASDRFFDLNQGSITALKEGYRIWPEEQQPDKVSYDPTNLPLMTDLPFDGLITRTPGVGLSLFTADCAPLVLYARDKQVLALLHIGRLGADRNLAAKAIDYLAAHDNVEPSEIVAHFGPSIAPASYVFKTRDNELADPRWNDFARSTVGGFAIDVVGFAEKSLLECGVPELNITKSPIDVATDPNYFSFTRHKQTRDTNGRHGFMVALKSAA